MNRDERHPFRRFGGRNMRWAPAVLVWILVGCWPYANIDIRVELPDSALEEAFDRLELGLRGRRSPRPAPKGVTVDTPEIEALQEARKERLQALSALLEAGIAGQSRDVRLVLRSEGPESLSPKELENARGLLDRENMDREALVAEIMRANSVKGTGNLKSVREVYTIVLRRRAGLNWWVQWPDGGWSRKDR